MLKEVTEKEITQEEHENAQVLEQQKKRSTEEWNFKKRYLPA